MERKTVAAINDISGIGICSLTVTLPVISAMGHQVCPAPTAVLSAHTGYKSYEFIDLTRHLDAYLNSWDVLDFKPDAVYTGFLGSEAQAEPVLAYLKRHGEALKIVDPVMGDDGILYKTYTPGLCEKIKALCAEADVITPNLTEACILSGTEYPEKISQIELEKITRALTKITPGKIVVTGVRIGEKLVNALFDGEKTLCIPTRYIDIPVCGAGDLFASALCGYLISGVSFYDAVKRSGEFLTRAISYTKECNANPKNGIIFEPLLKTL